MKLSLFYLMLLLHIVRVGNVCIMGISSIDSAIKSTYYSSLCLYIKRYIVTHKYIIIYLYAYVNMPCVRINYRYTLTESIILLTIKQFLETTGDFIEPYI